MADAVCGLASPLAEAEACFPRALEIARRRQARWLELRAAVSLARLLSTGSGRSEDDLTVLSAHEEARELLAVIYSWFSEGFDTVDRVEAKPLLAELGLG